MSAKVFRHPIHVSELIVVVLGERGGATIFGIRHWGSAVAVNRDATRLKLNVDVCFLKLISPFPHNLYTLDDG